jgi:hypothetical protein
VASGIWLLAAGKLTIDHSLGKGNGLFEYFGGCEV